MKKRVKKKACKIISMMIVFVMVIGLIYSNGGFTIYTEKVDAASYKVSNMQAGFIKGVDISSVIALEDAGVSYSYSDGTKGDIFDILKDAGVNYIRVRIWNDPYDSTSSTGYGGGNCDLEKAIELGKRATEHGMYTYIDFHYSDFWADPGKQYAPKAWKNYTAAQKATAIYDYTYSSLAEILDAGVQVGMVQIGNETNGSMCGMGGLYDGTWDLTSGVGAALQKGCEAVNAINSAYNLTGDNAIKKALHFTDALSNAEWYAECVDDYGIDYDVFAVSFYPFWHGSTSDLSTVLKKIAKKYDKQVMVAETSYPYTYTNSDSATNNIASSSDMTYSAYSVSQSGQMSCVSAVMNAVSSVNAQSGTSGYGLGAFYWEPAWVSTSSTYWSGQYGTGWASSYSGNYEKLFSSSVSNYSTSNCGTSWDNMAMFNSSGVALSSLQVFKEMGVTSYDKTEINNLISTASALSSSDYTSDSWATVVPALATATSVSSDSYATALDVSSAITDLQSAIDSLVTSESGSITVQNTISDGWYYIKSKLSNTYLTVDGDGADGDNVVISAGTDSASQKWYVTNQSDGYITLTNGLGKMLDVYNGSTSNGTNIDTCASNGLSTQCFKLSASGDYYGILTKVADDASALDLYAKGTTDGTNICQWTYKSSNNQLWSFESTTEPEISTPSATTTPSTEPTTSTTPSDSTSPTPSATPSASISTEEGNLEISTSVNAWNRGYIMNMNIENSTSATVTDWTLKLKTSEFTINSIWGGQK